MMMPTRIKLDNVIRNYLMKTAGVRAYSETAKLVVLGEDKSSQWVFMTASGKVPQMIRLTRIFVALRVGRYHGVARLQVGRGEVQLDLRGTRTSRYKQHTAFGLVGLFLSRADVIPTHCNSNFESQKYNMTQRMLSLKVWTFAM